MSLPLKLDFSNYDKFLTDPNFTTSAEAQDYFRNMDMLVEALIDVGLWQPETNYPNGHVVFSPNMPNGTEAVCVAVNGGKSGNTEPSWGEVGGDNVSDGTCFWKLRYKHWSKSVEAIADLTTGATNRLPNKAYAVGNVVYTDSNLSVALKCTAAGTTSNTELDISANSVGDTVTDGSVVWGVVSRDLTDSVQANTNKFANYLPTSVNPIKNATISGKVITLTFADDTTKTLTTQDKPSDMKDYIVESYRNGTEWYDVYHSGKVRQGGRISHSNSNTSITFLKAFNNLPSVYLEPVSNKNKYIGIAYIVSDSITTTSVTGGQCDVNGAKMTGVLQWIAEGQGA